MTPGISDRLLTQRLREMEHHALIERTVIPSSPVQILYAPTRRGEELLAALQPRLKWSNANPLAETPFPATRSETKGSDLGEQA